VSSLDELPGHLIRRLHQISVSTFMTELEKAGLDLTPVQYATLHALRQNPGVDQATLAGLIAYDKVTIGEVIARLVQRGYLSREVSTVDRRARKLQVDAKGRQALASASAAVLRAQEDMLCGLTPEERTLFMELLRKATDGGNALSRAPQRADTARAGAVQVPNRS
jgi:DNA-binding MarR family transcriptional regulator